MDKITSFAQYKETLAGARGRGWRLSNCFFLPAAAQEKIRLGTLSFLPLAEGLLLLDDNESFYRCYYFLPEAGELAPLSLDKPAVAEFPFTGALRDRQQREIDKLAALGFRLGRESGLMQAAPEELDIPDAADARVRFAQPSEVPAVLELLRSAFDPLYAFLPDEAELSAAAQTNRVFVAGQAGQVDAALFSDYEKQIATIRHVAVAPRCRGMGLGKALLNAYHRNYRAEAKRFQQWVDLNNTAAVTMYQAVHYTFSLRRANEYILTKEC